MLKTVVFDVDDTIYDQQQPFRKAINRIFPNVSCSDMHELYIRFRFHSDETFLKVIQNEWTLSYMRFYRLNESLKDLGFPSVTEEESALFQRVYEEELDRISMHTEIKKCLDFFSKKEIPMGIITNGPTDHQYKKIKQLELESWIPSENIIISQSTGFQKPDKEIFDLAAKEFGMQSDTTLYIGDSFENDVVGAHNGNWQSIWFNHRQRKLKETQKEYHLAELHSFEELFPFIETLF